MTNEKRQAWLRIGAGLLLALGCAGGAAADDDPLTAMDGRWHFAGSPYLWASGMSGTLSVQGSREIPVEASFADVMANFDIGLLARNEFRRDRVGFGVDLIYLNLGADVPLPPAGAAAGLGVDQRQLTVEAYGSYRVYNRAEGGRSAFVNVLAGARYASTRARLTSDAAALDKADLRLDWVDAVAGVEGFTSLGRKWGAHGRFDVAGFGSDFSWQGLAEVSYRPSPGFQLALGYRYLDVDYDDGTALYDVSCKGPQLRLTFLR